MNGDETRPPLQIGYSDPPPRKLININGMLVNPQYIVTAHMEAGAADPRTPFIEPTTTLVLKTVTAGELRFVGKDADLLWDDLTKIAEV